MRKAIIAIEDYRFYQHGALDLRGTLRAFVTNQAGSGTTQGGSSITQQMVKMTLVNQAKTRRAAGRGDRRTPTSARSTSCATRSRSRRSTPRTGSSSATSTSPTSVTAPTASRPPPGTTSPSRPAAHAARGRAARRPGEEPDRLRPDELPEPRQGAAQHRARPDGPAQRHLRLGGPPGRGAAARPRRRAGAQRLRLLGGAVLLRLRHPVPARRPAPSARPSSDRRRLLVQRRPDHQDHRRPPLPARRRRVGRAAT